MQKALMWNHAHMTIKKQMKKTQQFVYNNKTKTLWITTTNRTYCSYTSKNY